MVPLWAKGNTCEIKVFRTIGTSGECCLCKAFFPMRLEPLGRIGKTASAEKGRSLPIYGLTNESIRELSRVTFSQMQLRESDLQRVLQENVSIVAPDTLVIQQEFNDWDGSKRRIDMLAIDSAANLVVIELKRTDDGGHMELQALRYAAMVSAMTFDQAVDVYGRYLVKIGESPGNARSKLLDFLGWEAPDDDAFAQDVRIVLVSADFSPEITSSVLWLGERGIDIRCVRMHPYEFEGKTLLDIQQIIPLPEAADYQIKIKLKSQKERESRTFGSDNTRYTLRIGKTFFDAVPKNRAIFEIVSNLVKCGKSPEEIIQHCGPRSNRLLVSVEGEVDSQQFEVLAKADAAKLGRSFDTRRFFLGDDRLLVFEGRTYAFSNQWGGEEWKQAMLDLVNAFPDSEISFSEAS